MLRRAGRGEVCFQAESWRDGERVRAQMRVELGGARAGGIRPAFRAAVWAGLALLSAVMGEPLAAVPAVIAFENLVAPRIGRQPPSIGPLRPWHPPESYRESPEAPVPWALRRP